MYEPDEPIDPDDFRLGGSDVGSIVQLSDKNPPGEPFKHKTYPIGFDLRPGVHRKRHRKWRSVRPMEIAANKADIRRRAALRQSEEAEGLERC